VSLRKPLLLPAPTTEALSVTGPRALKNPSDSMLNNPEPEIYNRQLYDAMQDLGEDPLQYERLLTELVESLRPRKGAQRMLVEDIAWLRWQKRRNQRAQAGVMVRARDRVIAERAKRREELDREISDAPADEVAEHGLLWLPDSPSKFEKVRTVLDGLIDQARRNDFGLDFESSLTQLYGGKRVTMRARSLTNSFRRLKRFAPALAGTGTEAQPGGVRTHAPGQAPFLDPPKPEEEEPPATAESFEYERILLLHDLLDEKQQVNRAYEWYLAEHVHVTPALLNTCFAPNSGDDKVWRTLGLQERMYDREIERKTIILMQMQRPRASYDRPQRDKVTGKYVKKDKVTECSETDGKTR